MSVDVGTAIGYLDLDTSKFQQGFKSALSDLKTFGDNTKSAADRTAALGSAFTSAGSTLTKNLTLPLVAVGTAAVKVGNDFQAQMSRVKAISGATGDQFDLLKKQAIDLGASTAFSALEAAEGMENLASAGFSVEEIMAAMPGMMDLAASAGADLGTSADIAASALRGFGLEASDASHVADVFAKAAADTNAGVEDMGEAMKYVAPVAHAMGLSIEETAAAIGVMSDAGIKGSQAGTTLRSALTNLTKPTDQMAAVMEELGLSFFDARGEMLPLNEIIGQLNTKTKDLTQEQKNAAFATLFGKQALSGMLVLAEKGQDDFDALTKSLENSDGAAKAMAETMQDNAKSSIEEMLGALESAAIVIQEALEPMIRRIADAINEWVTSFVQLDKETQRQIISIAGIVAAIGPVLLIIGKLITSVSGIMSVVGKLGPLLAKLSGLFTGVGASATAGGAAATTSLAGVAAAAAPVIAIIAAVVAAIVALKIAWDNNIGGMRDKIQEGLDYMKREIGPAFESIKESIGKIVEAIKTTISNIIASIKSAWESDWGGMRTIVEHVFSTIGTIVKTALIVITDFVKLVAALLRGDWAEAWDVVKHIVQTVIEAVMSILQSWWNVIVTLFTKIKDSIVGKFIEIKDNVVEKVTEMVEAIQEWFNELPYRIGYALGYALQTIINWLTSMWEKVRTDIPKLIESIVTWFSELPGKMKQWLDAAITNVSNWIATMIQKAIEVGTNFVNTIVDWIKKLPDQFKTWFNNVISYLTGLPSQFKTIGINIMNGLFDGIKSVGDSILNWFQGLWNKVQDFISGIMDGMSDAKDAARGSSSHAAGLDYVPHDGYRATLHEGERVLTAEENRAYNAGSGGGGGDRTYNFYSPVPITPVEARKQMVQAETELALGFK